MVEGLAELRAQMKAYKKMKDAIENERASLRFREQQMVRWHYGNDNYTLVKTHKCDNPFGYCIYEDLSEICVICGDPYEQK